LRKKGGKRQKSARGTTVTEQVLSKYSVFRANTRYLQVEILQILRVLKAVFAVFPILEILEQILPPVRIALLVSFGFAVCETSLCRSQLQLLPGV
jgi:hypothetical protein